MNLLEEMDGRIWMSCVDEYTLENSDGDQPGTKVKQFPECNRETSSDKTEERKKKTDGHFWSPWALQGPPRPFQDGFFLDSWSIL